MPNAKSNPWVKQVRRQFYNWRRNKDTPKHAILLNSLPKSGTHLVHQILRRANYQDFEGFFASTPSWSMQKKSTAAATQALDRIYDNELYTGHIFYSPTVEEKIFELSLPSIFLYRDPRAVFFSEWHYLLKMNKYHRYHRLLRNLGHDEQFDLLLYGDKKQRFYFPPFSQRVEAYQGWITSQSAFKLKFEDLINPEKTTSCLKNLVKYLNRFSKQSTPDADAIVSEEDLLKAIQPEQSHTFTGLDPHRWTSRLSSSHTDLLNTETLTVRQALGY